MSHSHHSHKLHHWSHLRSAEKSNHSPSNGKKRNLTPVEQLSGDTRHIILNDQEAAKKKAFGKIALTLRRRASGRRKRKRGRRSPAREAIPTTNFLSVFGSRKSHLQVTLRLLNRIGVSHLGLCLLVHEDSIGRGRRIRRFRSITGESRGKGSVLPFPGHHIITRRIQYGEFSTGTLESTADDVCLLLSSWDRCVCPCRDWVVETRTSRDQPSEPALPLLLSLSVTQDGRQEESLKKTNITTEI
jgi:hypothetical protein